MSHATLKLIPGVDQNRTPTFNEAAISTCDLIRFQPDQRGVALPQKLGGWTKYYSSALSGVPKTLWAWEDANSTAHLAIGTTTNLYNLDSDILDSIAPQYYQTSRTVSATTTATPTASNVVTITDTGSNILTGDTVDILTHISVGGLILFGTYSCTQFDANNYKINATDILGNPIYPTSNVTNGGAVASFNVSSGSNVITVTLNNHGFTAGSYYPVLVSTVLGSSGITLYGNYIVQSVPTATANTFTIYADINAVASATTSINGGLAAYEYYIGNTIAPTSAGFGAGGFGYGGFGIGIATVPGREFTLSAVAPSTPSTGYVTYTFSGLATIPVGTFASITGVTPSGYNTTATGSLPVISTSVNTGAVTTSIVLQQATTGAATVLGTIKLTQYAPQAAADWTIANWGEILISCPKNGPIFQWDANSGSTTSSIITAAPVANDGMFIGMPQRQIIAYGSTFNGIQQPLLVRWCDIGNYNVWAAQITNQAGSYIIPKGSRIVGGIQGPQQALLWTDLACWAMQYVGQPYVYQFNEIGTGCGLIAQQAAGSLNGSVYWMGPSQFYRLSGGGVEPMQCPVWDVVYQNLNQNYVDKIRFASNARFGEIVWYYPSINSVGENDSYVKYNALINQWDFGTLNRTAWLDQSVLGAPLGTDSSGYIYQHETSPNADGFPMLSRFRTGYFEISDAEYKMFVDQVWPDMKWGYYNGTQSANVNITFYVTDYPGEADRVYGPYTLSSNTTFVTPRFRGRLVSIEISSNDLNSFWRLGAMRYRVQPDGKF
jgi:hypothetical protein